MPTIQHDAAKDKRNSWKKRLFLHLKYDRKIFLNQYSLHSIIMKIAIVESNRKAINLYENHSLLKMQIKS